MCLSRSVGHNHCRMFTTTENQKLTAAVFGWISFGIGGVGVFSIITAVVFRLLHGLDRESDGALALASGVALLALVFGGASGCYSCFLLRSRLAKVALALCVLVVPASLLIARIAAGHL